MAKTIKFNLICDDKPIRTIEDLQENFVIEDVLEYYNNKLLHKWLEVRGYTKELEQVNLITVDEPINVVKELIRIFNVVNDIKVVEESVYILNYLNERKALYDIYVSNKFKAEEIIDDYMNGYRAIKQEIIETCDDVAKIKAKISEIAVNYSWAFELDHRDFFWELADENILAIMCLLMNEDTRDYFMPVPDEDDNEYQFDIDWNDDKKGMYEYICELDKKTDYLKTQLGDHLLAFSGITDGYWKDLKSKDKQYMIINIGLGDYVRSAGRTGEEFSKGQIQDIFRILDGIDYKSNSATRTLYYMEV